MKAAILAVGDELTLGQIIDTNSAWLSAQLAEVGILTAYHLVVPDDVQAVCRGLGEAANRADVVLITGGLGPTPDDVTREALARAVDKPLQLDLDALRNIEAFFLRLGRPMPAMNRIQAMLPAGAQVLPNDCGTAPGIRLQLNRCVVFALPGVPHEMEAMFLKHVVPALRQTSSGKTILVKALHAFGAGESAVAERLGDLLRRDRNPLVGTTVRNGVVTVRIRSAFDDAERAHRELQTTRQAIERRLEKLIFGEDADTLEGVVGRLLAANGETLAVAESCTGGLIAKLLTDVPGASRYFIGGWVVYSNDAKQRELGVDSALLQAAGVVSEPVARKMAEGAVKRAGATYGLGVTGVAGPAGGSSEKPVGTVWIALAWKEGASLRSCAECGHFPGDRAAIRERAARAALNMLRLHLSANAAGAAQ